MAPLSRSRSIASGLGRQRGFFAGMLLGGFAVLALKDEVPNWATSGARMQVSQVQPSLGAFPIRLTSAAVVVFEGDSNLSGSRVGGAAHAVPALINARANSAWKTCNLAIGGARAVDWPERPGIDADLYVIMLGSNDAAARGWLSTRPPVSLDTYEDAMKRLIAARLAMGAQVLVLTPPPAGATAIDRRIQPYRLAARRAALATGASFADTAAAFADVGKEAVPLQFDALHLSIEGQELLAGWLMSTIELGNGAVRQATTGNACVH